MNGKAGELAKWMVVKLILEAEHVEQTDGLYVACDGGHGL
jgi:hypothetical protein